ncbi:MAG TPA: hypothetical protein DEB06_11030 [Phycisphaerales bacterium]|nr:hypothetical protein [Phycisphaerales bacterium]
MEKREAEASAPDFSRWFKGPMEHPPLSSGFALSMALAATFMLLMPAIYAGLLALIALGTVWFIVHVTVPAFEYMRHGLVLLTASVMPLAGFALLAMMIKPLFARRRGRRAVRTVSGAEAPGLYALVGQVAALMGAPRPSRIDVDCSANASASFRRGVLSFGSDDLVLTVGLPLVEGLNLRQFVGVVAHELAHFSQRGSMRAAYLTRAIDGWLSHAAEEDEIDEAIEDLVERDPWWIIGSSWGVALVAGIGRFMLRVLLKGLSLVGRLVTAALLRQMEYRADRSEAVVAGADAFVKTMVDLAMLSSGERRAMEDVGRSFSRMILPNDLPALIAVRAKTLPPPMRWAIEERLQRDATGPLDSHPSTRDRARAVQRVNDPGLFVGEGSTVELFVDFHKVCASATKHFYDRAIGPAGRHCRLASWIEIVHGREAVEG